MAVPSILQPQNFLLSGGISICPYGIVLSTYLLKVYNVSPMDTSNITTLYKPIIGLGGDIRHIFNIIKFVCEVTSSTSRFEVILEVGFTTTVDERKSEGAILRE